MPFSNLCPINLTPLNKTKALLVKVPPPSFYSAQKPKYFYIADEETLNKLTCCPFTKRNGVYHTVKLKDLSKQQMALLAKNNEKTLLEDNDILDQLNTHFAWKVHAFPRNPILVRRNPDIQRPIPYRDANVNWGNSTLTAMSYSVGLAIASAYLMLIEQSIINSINSSDEDYYYSSLQTKKIYMIAAIVGLFEFCSRKLSNNRHGIFSTILPVDRNAHEGHGSRPQNRIR